MLKRCFAFLLVLLLLVGLFPTAFAEGTGAIEETAPEEIEESEEIVPEAEEPEPPQEDESWFPEDDRLLDDDFALYAGAEITGAPNAFANLTLPSGGIDIPAQGAEHSKDGFIIRRNAIETGVNVLTSLDTANALLTSLESSCREDLSLVDIAEIDKEIESKINEA